MEFNRVHLLLFFVYSFLILSQISIATSDNGKDQLKTYIVFVRDTANHVIPATADDVLQNITINAIHKIEHLAEWYVSLLSSVVPEKSRLIYSYRSLINGFAAQLTAQEVEELSKQEWFAGALPSRKYNITTTHTPAFLGLSPPSINPRGAWNISNLGEGVIIGIIDTGITPDHPSFRDDHLPHPPTKWKGHCDFGPSLCNNKLIGARRVLNAAEGQGHDPPIDKQGHGTHVASTAAGSFVNGAGAYGSAVGTASGMAPRAHLAMYQACNEFGQCEGADVLKAMEYAINDGVDVLSLSLGLMENTDGHHMYEDHIAIGAFKATLKGIVVSCAAGNSGPSLSTVENDAPWILTVGASVTDRRELVVVELSNGTKVEGRAVMQPKNWPGGMFPLTHLSIKESNGYTDIPQCIGKLDKIKVGGKILVCSVDGELPFQKSQEIRAAGVRGVIFVNFNFFGLEDSTLKYDFPYAQVLHADGMKIFNYINSSKNAAATFSFRGTVMNKPHSPSLASFSSRGPSVPFPGILKPDIVGPGSSILAAVPPAIFLDRTNNKSILFDFMSGTSMATPHLSGIAALIKKAHPNWSPAAIKSAIMTTAGIFDNNGGLITDSGPIPGPADLYGIGAGQVDPSRAIDPGLVYDINGSDYIRLLCGLGSLTDDQIGIIISPLSPVTCSKVAKISQEQLNYPSVTVSLKPNSTVVISRTVTNVGLSASTYQAKINTPRGISAVVQPALLRFNAKNEKITFTVTFKWTGSVSYPLRGQLVWLSGKQVVRSPISIILLN